MSRVKVADGWTVFVPAKGEQVPSGGVIEIDTETAAYWVDRGWVVRVSEPKPRAKRS